MLITLTKEYLCVLYLSYKISQDANFPGHYYITFSRNFIGNFKCTQCAKKSEIGSLPNFFIAKLGSA